MPHKTFPRALAGGVVLVVLSYALPLMIGLGVTSVIKDWKLGYFAYIAKEVPIHLPGASSLMKIDFTILSLAIHIRQ